MRLTAFIMTCAQRTDELAATLEDFKQTDWPEAPVLVSDVNNFPDKVLSITCNALLVMQEAQRREWEYMLFLEDDVKLNRHLYHNLTNWVPITYGFLRLGSLYNADKQGTGKAIVSVAEAGYYCSHTASFYNSQGLVIHRSMLELILAHWGEFNTEMHDIRISRIIGRVDPLVYCPLRDWVQHRTEVSTWGGEKHTSSDFDREHKL